MTNEISQEMHDFAQNEAPWYVHEVGVAQDLLERGAAELERLQKERDDWSVVAQDRNVRIALIAEERDTLSRELQELRAATRGQTFVTPDEPRAPYFVVTGDGQVMENPPLHTGNCAYINDGRLSVSCNCGAENRGSASMTLEEMQTILASLPIEWEDRYGLKWQLHLHWTSYPGQSRDGVDLGIPHWQYGYAARGTTYFLGVSNDLATIVTELKKMIEALQTTRGPERTGAESK